MRLPGCNSGCRSQKPYRSPLSNVTNHLHQRLEMSPMTSMTPCCSLPMHSAVSSPPHPQLLNKQPLFVVRGDLFAYEVKTGVKEPTSVKVGEPFYDSASCDTQALVCHGMLLIPVASSRWNTLVQSHQHSGTAHSSSLKTYLFSAH